MRARTCRRHTFDDSTTVSVGRREVELRYLGRTHTDHDIVVRVPDAEVVFAGDMIEEGACPALFRAWRQLDGVPAHDPARVRPRERCRTAGPRCESA